MQPHPNVQAVQDALDAAGARDGAGAPCRVGCCPTRVHTAAAAAEALGVEVGQIANSLIFDADGEPLLVLTSGAHRVDTAGVAADLGVGKLRRATPEFVRRAHRPGRSAGSPRSGTPSRCARWSTRRSPAYDEIWAAGGVPQAVFPTTYAELLRITAGTAAEVA